MLIFIIILLIVIVYLYNQTLIETKKKEEYTSTKLVCNRNCGNYNINRISTDVAGCLSCDSCGVCTLPNKSQMCLNGNINGAYFSDDCSGVNWKFGNSVYSQPPNNYYFDYDYEKQLQNLGQITNLPSQATDVSYEIEPTVVRKSRQLKKQTTDSLSELLGKINSSSEKNTIDKDTVKQLQEILVKLKNQKS
jgi:hypothetical protein